MKTLYLLTMSDIKSTKAILITRVSTDVQDPVAQVSDLENYAKEFGFNEFHIIETKETGYAEFHQKKGTALAFKYIESNPDYNTIFCTEISRLSRDKYVLQEIERYLTEQKIQLYIKDQGFKLFDKGEVHQHAHLTFYLYGLFADSEMKQKKERFIRKRRDNMRMGKSISGKPLFGFERIKPEGEKSYYIHHPENADYVKDIFIMYAYGINNAIKNPSIRLISQECITRGYPKYTHSKRNLNKLLKEKGYLGKKTTNNRRKNPKFRLVPGEAEYIVSKNEIRYCDEPIIEKDLFDLVQTKMADKTIPRDKKTVRTTILSKLISCESCGRKLGGNYRFPKDKKSKRFSHHSYRCTGRTDTIPCLNKKSYSMQMLDSTLWSLIRTDLKALGEKINELDPNVELISLSERLNNIHHKLSEIDKDIYELEKQANNFSGEDVSGLIEFGKKLQLNLNRLKNQRKPMINESKILETQIRTIKSKIDTKEKLVNINVEYIESSKEKIKQYINHFIESVNLQIHDREKSVLQVKFKYYTIGYRGVISRDKEHGSMRIDDGLDKFVTVVIDKKNTNNLKLYKATKRISNEVISSFISQIDYKAQFTEFDYFKLNLYSEKYGDC